ncbi:uncharacterized protein LOC111249933 isoform X2 [Varroa destructor]|uniref:Uncharacterized protein n=1 Tax=Varroa destructor TaxID=109461 RepID=A0A7M7K182_VARDE|nr:uncharacterized protein LOC111249933 isoform X2 [Varroa destructor]
MGWSKSKISCYEPWTYRQRYWLRLGAKEISVQHRANLRRLTNEMRANCCEYALLQGAGRADKRRTALRYSRLFQKAVDEYVASTQMTAPIVEYLDALENLQEHLIKVLKFQQQRKYAVQAAQETPCRCFEADKRKKDVLALVQQVAENLSLRKNAETQTHNEPSGIELAVQVQPEMSDQNIDATRPHRSVGLGDGILIPDVGPLTVKLEQEQWTSSAPAKAACVDLDPLGAYLSSSSSQDNSPSLGDLLTKFRLVLRDEAGPSNSVVTTSQRKSATARRRFEEAKRRLGGCGRPFDTASDDDSFKELYSYTKHPPRQNNNQ